MFLKDTDGDDKADVRVRVLDGLDSADTHHTSNSFQLDPGGALYFQEGTFHHTQVETPYGPPVRCANAGVFRYEPRAQKFEVYVTYRLRQPARPRLRPLGPGHRRRRHRRQSVSRRPVLRPPRLSATSTPSPPQVYKQRHAALPRHRDPLQPALPRANSRATCSSPTSSASRASSGTRSRTRAPASPAPKLEPILSSTRSELPPVRHQDRAGRRHLLPRLAEPDHRPHAAQPPRPQPRPDPRPHLPRHLRGPRRCSSRRRSPASRSRSCSTCSRSRRTASATAPGSSWAAARPRT